LCSAYKLYAAVFTERLRKKTEENSVLSESQVGFRKGRGTMDNIFVLQYVIDKELRKKGGKFFGFFMDLKAAFDKVDRRTLWEIMRKRGNRKGLTERDKEIYESTKSAVRIRGETSEWFWIKKRVRQEYPLSPLLLFLLIANIKKEMRRSQVEGAQMGERGSEPWHMQMTWCC